MLRTVIIFLLLLLAGQAWSQSARDFPTPSLGERVPLMLQGCLNTSGQAVPVSLGTCSPTGITYVAGTVTSNQGTPAPVANAWPTYLAQGGAVLSNNNPIFVQLTAGSALAGKFGIDQTTPGGTNGVVVNASALPAGAATAANQTSVESAPGTSAGVALTVQGVVNGVPQPIQGGNTTAVKTDASATTQPVSNGGTFAVQNTAPTPAGTAVIGKVGIDQTTPGATNGVVVNGSALPAGASTSALQSSTQSAAGAQPAAVTGVQGVTGGTPIGTSTTNGAVEAGGNLATLVARTPTPGQKTSALSTPVVLPSDQGPLVVSGYAGSAGDASIATGGTAQTLFGGATPVNGWAIDNPNVSDDLWCSDSTTAAINGQGSYRIAANGGGHETPQLYKPVGPLSCVGPVTGDKITARRW